MCMKEKDTIQPVTAHTFSSAHKELQEGEGSLFNVIKYAVAERNMLQEKHQKLPAELKEFLTNNDWLIPTALAAEWDKEVERPSTHIELDLSAKKATITHSKNSNYRNPTKQKRTVETPVTAK